MNHIVIIIHLNIHIVIIGAHYDKSWNTLEDKFQKAVELPFWKEKASNANRYLKAKSFMSVGPEVMQSKGVWVLLFSGSSKHDLYTSQVAGVF